MNKIDAYKRIALATVLLGLNSLSLADEGLVALDNQSTNIQNDMNSNSRSNTKKRMGSPNLGDKKGPYNNPNRFLMDASFIYWQAITDGLDYGIDQKFVANLTGQTNNFGFTVTDQINEKDINFKWEPGFKVGVGAIIGDHDEWDIMLNWTWLHSKASVRSGTGETVNLNGLVQGQTPNSPSVETDFQIGNWSPTLLGTPATQSNTSWKLLYNTIDLELGRNFFLGKGLTFRPHMGVRGALLHQNTNVNYDIASVGSFVMPVFLSQSPMAGSSFGSSQFKGKNHFNGVGLRGGFDMRWNFLRSFAVYSSLATSILWGEFHIKETFDVETTITPRGGLPMLADSYATLKTTLHRIRTNLQASMGFMWHTGFNNDKQHLAIRVGYEFNEWFQQNELKVIQNGTLQFNATRTPGDLGLQGVTVDLRFDL